MPEDLHYDIVIAHLKESLQSLNVDHALLSEVITLAERGRNGLLGK
jgi:hypothetical protein